MKKLSIIIVNYNSSKFLKDCLNSLNQNGEVKKKKEEWEIIVIDNHSSEDLRDLKSFLKAYPLQTTFLENKRNLGFSSANNKALLKAEGNYILFLNPDTIVSCSAIEFVLNYLINNKEAGAATCRVLLKSGVLDDASHRGFPTPWNAFCYFTGLAAIFSKSEFFNGYHLGYKNMDKIHEIDACGGAFMMTRKDCGKEIDWFDEDFFWYGEDLDYCFRAKQRRWKVVYIPNVAITHLKGVSSGIKKHSQTIASANREIKRKAQRARFEAMRIFYQKNYQKKYPFLISKLVVLGIKIKELITNLTS